MDGRRRFQHVTRQAVLDGQNVVLQAPTGAGKTRAVLEPGLLGFDYDRENHTYEHPPRILYLQPMRTLAAGALKTLRGAYTKYAWPYVWQPRIQAGDQPEDAFFEGKLIVATVDQMLASLLTLPYGVGRRFDNLNAGAMIGAYLIFDEFHLYPRQEMMLTVLAMLRLLKGVSQFALMSATFSAIFLQAIAREMEATFIGDPPDREGESLFVDVTNVQTQVRTWNAVDGALDTAAVVRLRGRRTLCVCNVVARARALYVQIREALPDADVILLHSQFFTSHRMTIQERLLAQFEDDTRPPERDLIVIATQVVEVGLDISVDVLLTECAPAASLIQRAGRCARRDHQSGMVYVFQPYDEDGQVNYAPYVKKGEEEGDGLEGVCERTWGALTDPAFSGQVIRFTQEQQLVDRAHGDHDAAFVQGLREKLDRRADEIVRCWAVRDDGDLRKLIRTIDTVPLFIHPNPTGDTIGGDGKKEHDPGLTEAPFRYESLNLSRPQIARLVESYRADNCEADIPFYGCTARSNDGGTKDDDAMVTQNYVWHRLGEAREAYGGGYAWFAVEPHAVSYDAQTGFGASASMVPAQPSPPARKKEFVGLNYRVDTYVEHITGLYRAYMQPVRTKKGDQEPLRDEFMYPLRRVCERAKLDAETGERMLRLILALHDAGKLNSRWQDWAHAWQRFYAEHLGTPTRLLDPSFPLAHTDTGYDRRDPTIMARVKAFRHRPRGPHAVESAEACYDLLVQASGQHIVWTAAAIAAIMHHHTPDASESGAFRLAPGSHQALAEALAVCGFSEADAAAWTPKIRSIFEESGLPLKKMSDAVRPALDRAEKMNAWLVYLLFVRTLRLADQRSSDALSASLRGLQ